MTHQVVVRKRKAGEGDPHERRRVRIAAVSKPARGRPHDKKVYDRTRTTIPRTAAGFGDAGYVGTRLQGPFKRPRGGALSRRRMAVERGIGKMKMWRIAADRDRNPLRRHAVMMQNVAGLHDAMFS